MIPIRVLIVDDHKVIRTGLVSFLETQEFITVAGEAGSGKQALEFLENQEVDVVLMDITMPEMDGMESTRILKQRFPDVQVLVLSVHEDKQYFFEMINAGASGYITKKSAAETLVEALHSVARGQVYLQPVLARWLLDSYQILAASSGTDAVDPSIPTKREALDVLSDREVEVLELVANGLTSKDIAEELEISPNTVSRHRERIMRKLNLHNAAELTRFAIRAGLIKP